MARRQLAQQKTVLIVGEGFSDTAFLKHLKSIYDSRHSGVRVTIKNAQGKGSNNVIDTAIKTHRRFAYDLVGVLYDIDVPLTPGFARKARTAKLILVETEPCLEGLLLKILKKYVPNSCKDCKSGIRGDLIGNDLTESAAYAGFTKETLEKSRSSIPDLDRLILLIQGNKPS